MRVVGSMRAVRMFSMQLRVYSAPPLWQIRQLRIIGAARLRGARSITFRRSRQDPNCNPEESSAFSSVQAARLNFHLLSRTTLIMHQHLRHDHKESIRMEPHLCSRDQASVRSGRILFRTDAASSHQMFTRSSIDLKIPRRKRSLTPRRAARGNSTRRHANSITVIISSLRLDIHYLAHVTVAKYPYGRVRIGRCLAKQITHTRLSDRTIVARVLCLTCSPRALPTLTRICCPLPIVYPVISIPYRSATGLDPHRHTGMIP